MSLAHRDTGLTRIAPTPGLRRGLVRAADFVALLPLVTIATTAIVVMIAIAIRRNQKAVLILSLLGVAAALGSLRLAASAVPRQITTLLLCDAYSRIYMAISPSQR